MCLLVLRSFVKHPIPQVTCWKLLEKQSYGWITPYLWNKIPRNGKLTPNQPSKRTTEFKTLNTIEKGYIHAFTTRKEAEIAQKRLGENHHEVFLAIATDVTAIGYANDLICKALYIPELDLTTKS